MGDRCEGLLVSSAELKLARRRRDWIATEPTEPTESTDPVIPLPSFVVAFPIRFHDMADRLIRGWARGKPTHNRVAGGSVDSVDSVAINPTAPRTLHPGVPGDYLKPCLCLTGLLIRTD